MPDVRTVHWLFLVSVGLFIGGVGFIIAASRTVRTAVVVEEAPAIEAVATTQQIMSAMVVPAANAIYEAVGTSISAAGVKEWSPQTDAEWTAVADSAVMLIEAGNLLLLGNRAVDRGDWVTMSRAMMQAAHAVQDAAAKKSVDGVFAAGDDITMACDNCHAKYQR